jgi:hypothetical protein
MGLRSEIRDPEKTYSGSRIQFKKAPDPGSGSATLIFKLDPCNSKLVNLTATGYGTGSELEESNRRGSLRI